ncbi:MAG: DUF2087 domain-containing protein [Oscillospiraceae bacterium]|jgi:hypothetical protein|nr:DUF2087 domain-containing protein [Oscillospiraceae bacterium]
MVLENMDVPTIRNGYSYDAASESYICYVCGAAFAEGEAYPTKDGRFLLARKAVEAHMTEVHGDRLDTLLDSGSKYVCLTDNQKQLLRQIAAGRTDGEIARTARVTASTVRHQRFQFREKAKQAKMYLAVYELAMQKGRDEFMNIHSDTGMVDERFVITREEQEKIVKGAFASLEPLRLRQFPAREKKKVAVLAVIAELFEKGKIYTEKEVNEILQIVYEDFATLRRYLIVYKHLDRKRDGSEYWVR